MARRRFSLEHSGPPKTDAEYEATLRRFVDEEEGTKREVAMIAAKWRDRAHKAKGLTLRVNAEAFQESALEDEGIDALIRLAVRWRRRFIDGLPSDPLIESTPQ